LLYEAVKDFGFGEAEVKQMMIAAESQPGKLFHSADYRIVKDRDCFLIQKRINGKEGLSEYALYPNATSIHEPIILDCSVVPTFKFNGVIKQDSLAILDYDKLQFPLIIRKWKAGDWFIPFGMKGKKKISDFFVDAKLSLPDKDDAWLLVSGKDVVWVIGRRIDNRYRITESTQTVYQVICKNS
jgi:tRNA(Ile)-lysidine synthase